MTFADGFWFWWGKMVAELVAGIGITLVVFLGLGIFFSFVDRR